MGTTRAVFLDRDGTILELVEYLHDPDRVRLIPGVAAALRRIGEAGWLRVVCTNQSGIARGWFTRDAVDAVHERMLDLLRAEGADIDRIEVCPHHPDFGSPCTCRKPAGGMLERAAEALGIHTSRSWIIGDRIEDLQAGRVVGARGILVLSGYGRDQILTASPEFWRNIRFVARDLPAAASLL